MKHTANVHLRVPDPTLYLKDAKIVSLLGDLTSDQNPGFVAALDITLNGKRVCDLTEKSEMYTVNLTFHVRAKKVG